MYSGIAYNNQGKAKYYVSNNRVFVEAWLIKEYADPLVQTVELYNQLIQSYRNGSYDAANPALRIFQRQKK